MKKSAKIFSGICLFAVAALGMGSCTTPKKITYIQDMDDSVVIENVQRRAMTVQPDDKLSIVVHSKDPELAVLFNLPVVASSTRNVATSLSGARSSSSYSSAEGMSSYTVSPEGNIEFPVLGKLHIAGMTRNEIAAFIKGELIGRNLVKDPTVIVEFINTGISVMGEVKSPGRYDMNRDNLTIMEALAVAGDLTIQGRRENVKVVREERDGTMRVYTIDLTNGKQMMSSPGYYLKQNDIIYVEPSNFQKRTTTVNGNTALSASFWVSIASFLVSIAVLVFK